MGAPPQAEAGLAKQPGGRGVQARKCSLSRGARSLGIRHRHRTGTHWRAKLFEKWLRTVQAEQSTTPTQTSVTEASQQKQFLPSAMRSRGLLR